MLGTLLFLPLVGAAVIGPRANSQSCPGYKASHVNRNGHTLTADLTLAGKPCDTYGTDLKDLKLLVEYQTHERLHVIIYDADEQVYQVPESVLPRVGSANGIERNSALKFDYVEEPFSFTVSRNGDVLFDTSASNLIFQSQYLNLRTWLPNDPYLYGLGEHTDSLRLQTNNYTRTLWNRDSYGVPSHSNLYGTHPVYYDHRGSAGTHGVFLANSNGMDIKINKTMGGKQYLEYNILGGVFDFYFFTGSTPKEASIQYAEVVGLPAMQSYWTFGVLAEVVYNYSQAGIPLETMWTDIDYMDLRRVFTLDPERFPLEKMRELVDYLHDNNQHYIVMVDPAVSVSDNPGYRRGVEQDIFLKTRNSSLYQGAVWPGVTVYPDWFHTGIQDYWNGEFNKFFDAETGIDIDGLWIDMNEAANMCTFPCTDPETYSIENDLPPAPPAVRPSNPRPLSGFPQDFQPASSNRISKRFHGDKLGLPGRNLLRPQYSIQNAAGALSQKTIQTNIGHAGVMSSASRVAMQQRRPDVRPLIVTRSTYAGAGAHVGHWLGDNLSTWELYRVSIAQILAFSSVFQIPMVGADVCGFGSNTTEELCARWASLGAFYTFYRNHNEIGNIPQEYYLWKTVMESATKAINIRYQLLDYIYTAFHRQSETGEPFLQPLFYLYPEDENTFAIDLQFFYGDAILISPVTKENSTSVNAYFPKDIFYDWYTGAAIQGQGTNITLSNINITHIPIHIRGGNIVPIRSSGAMTTAELRKKGFQLIIAPGAEGTATGTLYLDDGDSLEQADTANIEFVYRSGVLNIKGQFMRDALLNIESVVLLGQPTTAGAGGQSQKQVIETRLELTAPTRVKLA
ncbi:glycosyl hydrolases family 31-domain-containing protein [Aspergillus recurvatus]